MDSSTITYEHLYEIVRKEKITEEIEKLSPDTYRNIISYLRAKLESYRLESANGTAEAENIKLQIQSARKLAKELYERRERKILMLAINRSRAKSESIDTSLLLPEELPMLEEATKTLDKFRASILLPLVNAKAIEAPRQELAKSEQSAKESKPAASQNIDVKIKFIEAVPRFRGFDEIIYGPFSPGDKTSLPAQFAKLLIEKKKALPD